MSNKITEQRLAEIIQILVDMEPLHIWLPEHTKAVDRDTLAALRDYAVLRRPVVHGDEVESVRACIAELKAYWAGNPGDVPYNLTRYFEHGDLLLSCLDAAQREIQRLSTELTAANSDTEKFERLWYLEQHKTEDQQSEIARLSAPPEERREIVERQAERRDDVNSSACLSPAESCRAVDDIDTLLQDLARASSAHDAVMAERNHYKARAEEQAERIGFLQELVDGIEKQLGIAPDSEDTTIGTEIAKLKECFTFLRGQEDHWRQSYKREANEAHVAKQRIERLEGALRKVVEWNSKYPSSRIYNELDIRRIAAEMDEINAECTLELGAQPPQRFEAQVLSGCSVRAELQREALAAADGRQHHEYCDTNERNAEGIVKPCNCATADGGKGE